MFDNLTAKLNEAFSKITGRGVLSKADIEETLAEVRTALLDADVGLEAVKHLINTIQTEALGEKIIKSVEPGQMVIKLVHDKLVAFMGGEKLENPLEFKGAPPHIIMMVGLQGSGKTTSTVKIAKWLEDKKMGRVLVASLDTRRPAAMEQLKILADGNNIKFLPIINGQNAVNIAKRALSAGKHGDYKYVILDTAGRLSIDDELIKELQEIKKVTTAREVMFVCDALSGQSALDNARQFHEKVGLNGAMLTRIDGDSRGGAALSLQYATNCPIKFLGAGETIDKIEQFNPDKIARQILGMGDIVSLVEKIQASVAEEESEKIAKRMMKGIFTLNDFADQLKQMRKMGDMKDIMGMIPGMGAMKNKMADMPIDDKMFVRMEAIISSMTKQERLKPDMIQAKRKIRIAKGSGTTVQEVNRLLKQHLTMANMVKQMGRLGPGGLARNIGSLMNMANRFQ